MLFSITEAFEVFVALWHQLVIYFYIFMYLCLLSLIRLYIPQSTHHSLSSIWYAQTQNDEGMTCLVDIHAFILSYLLTYFVP